MVLCVSTKMGFGFDLYFCITMIKFYVKCGCVSHRDLVSWTSMISGYVCEGNCDSAFVLFLEMMVKFEPNPVILMVMLQISCACKFEARAEILTSILDAYTHLGALQWGEAIHVGCSSLTCRLSERKKHTLSSGEAGCQCGGPLSVRRPIANGEALM
ncbi:pentatricopeptide repeat-containing protein [Quercus suber]|uniref:Pentatricopeptide repeat-containing protein n=1 Tax=Quercus suber TaxID=58331 RepID=A0AAW0KSU1_QUESU